MEIKTEDHHHHESEHEPQSAQVAFDFGGMKMEVKADDHHHEETAQVSFDMGGLTMEIKTDDHHEVKFEGLQSGVIQEPIIEVKVTGILFETIVLTVN